MDTDTTKRRKTVSALAVRAKTDRKVVPELWGMVEGLIRTVCARYCRYESGNHLYELEDLCQSSYFGFLRAVDTYDPERGAFSTHLQFYIRNTCRLETRKHHRDPISTATSLDKPLDDTDGRTLADAIPDPNAPESFEAVGLQTVADVILAEVENLPHIRQRRVIRECTYQGRSFQSIADEFRITREAARMIEERSVRLLRRRPIIRELYEEFHAEEQAADQRSKIDPYRAKGITSFRSDFTSAVEAIVMRMEG